jgi:hypothetical protein
MRLGARRRRRSVEVVGLGPELGRVSRAPDRDGLGEEAEVLEEALHFVAVEDHGDEGEARLALRAAEDIEAEAVLHERGPARVFVAGHS